MEPGLHEQVSQVVELDQLERTPRTGPVGSPAPNAARSPFRRGRSHAKVFFPTSHARLPASFSVVSGIAIAIARTYCQSAMARP